MDMKLATLLCSSLLCAALGVAQQGPSPVFACNLKAIPAAERPHYNDLTKRLWSAARDRKDLPDGYAVSLDGRAIRQTEIAEWIRMERLCCPFLSLQVAAYGNPGDWILRLTGPKGVKAFLEAEFTMI